MTITVGMSPIKWFEDMLYLLCIHADAGIRYAYFLVINRYGNGPGRV